MIEICEFKPEEIDEAIEGLDGLQKIIVPILMRSSSTPEQDAQQFVRHIMLAKHALVAMGAYLEVKMGERKACCNCAFCGLAMDVAPCAECQGAETKYSKWAKRHPILDGPALERGPHDELL